MDLVPPVLLTRHHATDSFDCGKEPLNTFLHRFALQNQAGGLARTYVLLADGEVVGYYSLTPAGVDHADAPDRITKGQARHPVPCILLARLAVDRKAHGLGIGKLLFRDAILRAYAAHESIGGRAFLVHAMDDEARQFYLKFGMLTSPTHPLHLFLLFKDIRVILTG